MDNKLKTPKDITELNYNDVAFFFGVSTAEAKLKVLLSYNLTFEKSQDYYDDRGNLKIKATDFALKKDLEVKLKSCSHLEGKDRIDYLIKFYNKGIPLSKLQEYANSKTFVKALKFTGKHSILNHILNKEQLRVVQKTWLLENTYYVSDWSKKCMDFIKNNDWTKDYLATVMDFETRYVAQLDKLEDAKRK